MQQEILDTSLHFNLLNPLCIMQTAKTVKVNNTKNYIWNSYCFVISQKQNQKTRKTTCTRTKILLLQLINLCVVSSRI